MSEILYTQIDRALELELDLRAIAGRRRSTADLNYMVGKIANVEIIAYKSDKRTENEIIDRIGGKDVRTEKYLPGGFLQTTEVHIKQNNIDFSAEGYFTQTTSSYFDTSRRIYPIITSADITIGDHSMGLLNKASINIVIPNPDRDLNWFESTWMRPGRTARMQFVYPESAVISGTTARLRDAMPTSEILKKRFPDNDEDEILETFSKLNQVTFDGLITSFQMEYQQDMSVNVTLQLTGTSNVYTDITLLMDPDKAKENPTSLDISTITVDNPAPAGVSTTPPDPAPTGSNYIFKELEETLDQMVLGGDKTKHAEIITKGEQKLHQIDNHNDYWALYGQPYPTGSANYNRYVTLGYLVQFINETVLTKYVSDDQTKPKIICDSEICPGSYYTNIVSANPADILLMGNKSNYYGSGSAEPNITYYSDINAPDINFLSTDISRPAKIFINLELIKKITDSLLSSGTSFKLSNLFSSISNSIQQYTGNAVKMKLITNSDPALSDQLIFYDVSKVTPTKKTQKIVIPYVIPMTANDPRGTIVLDFKFSSKVPESVKSLSYVLNQNPDKISDEDIAPYLHYMYQRVDITKEVKGNVITYEINKDAKTSAESIAKKYSDTYYKYQNQLAVAKKDFAENPNNISNIGALSAALNKYIQYPTDTITKSNEIAAPIFPFDVEFTVDGINGFRYGDVLKFNGLPTRYRDNAVFSVISVSHTVSTSGEWKTVVRCIMRPRID